MGVESVANVKQRLSLIRRVGTLSGVTQMMVEDLTAPLSVDGLDALQVVVLVEGRNYGQPRQDFES